MSPVSTTVWLLFVVVLVSATGKRWNLPQPILLVIAGIGLSFIPSMARFHLSSESFFSLFIPPLLFADGWLIPKRELVNNRYSVLLLGFGLVFATAFGIGYAVHWLVPTIPLASAIALGAVISPTDTVTLSAILERVSLPKRLVYILSGESLINDAAGLFAFKFAIASYSMASFSFGQSARTLAWISFGGIVTGLAVSQTVFLLRNHLTRRRVEDPTILTALSLVTPYFAYLTAQSLSVSGILSVVAAGILAGINDGRVLSGTIRIQAANVWNTLTFALEGFVFLVMGLLLKESFSRMTTSSSLQLIGVGLLVSLATILIRMGWVFPFSRISWLLNRIHHQDMAPLPWNQVFLGGWLGIRGAVTLAAAFSIPAMVNGHPFPGRDFIISVAGIVILVSMLLPFLTVNKIVDLLHITDDRTEEMEEQQARIKANQGAIASLLKRIQEKAEDREEEIITRLIEEYRLRLLELEERKAGTDNIGKIIETERKLRLFAIGEERKILSQLHGFRTINDQTYRNILMDLDLVESSLSHLNSSRTRS